MEGQAGGSALPGEGTSGLETDGVVQTLAGWVRRWLEVATTPGPTVGRARSRGWSGAGMCRLGTSRWVSPRPDQR